MRLSAKPSAVFKFPNAKLFFTGNVHKYVSAYTGTFVSANWKHSNSLHLPKIYMKTQILEHPSTLALQNLFMVLLTEYCN